MTQQETQAFDEWWASYPKSLTHVPLFQSHEEWEVLHNVAKSAFMAGGHFVKHAPDSGAAEKIQEVLKVMYDRLPPDSPLRKLIDDDDTFRAKEVEEFAALSEGPDLLKTEEPDK